MIRLSADVPETRDGVTQLADRELAALKNALDKVNRRLHIRLSRGFAMSFLVDAGLIS